ncbi:MAG TPA: FdtA/QdtA family cupin domain-containing protein [Gammaproteobacteria bacterium]|nr:FdtA/QdtA family cupin domain-containing protein [Gammaproteobacteria bacterium]
MVEGCKVVQIPSITDERGAISFVQLGQLLDFAINRVYWLYDLKNTRGGHAHKQLKQFIFCVHGSVDFVLDDVTHKQIITLDSPNKGLIIEKPMWREVQNSSPDAAVIILASDIYDEQDYIRSYDEFKKWKSNHGDKK